MARKNQAAVVELDLVGHEVSRRRTRFPVPVLDNATFAPPATTNIALDMSPHGESQDLVVGAERGLRLSQGILVSSAHASTATATASLYFLSA